MWHHTREPVNPTSRAILNMARRGTPLRVMCMITGLRAVDAIAEIDRQIAFYGKEEQTPPREKRLLDAFLRAIIPRRSFKK